MSEQQQCYENEWAERDVNPRLDRWIDRNFRSMALLYQEKGGVEATEWSPAVDYDGQLETHFMRDAPRAVLAAEFDVEEDEKGHERVSDKKRELIETAADTRMSVYNSFCRIEMDTEGRNGVPGTERHVSRCTLGSERAVQLVCEYLFGENTDEWVRAQLEATSLQTTVPSLTAKHKVIAAARKAGADDLPASDSDSGFPSESDGDGSDPDSD